MCLGSGAVILTHFPYIYSVASSASFGMCSHSNRLSVFMVVDIPKPADEATLQMQRTPVWLQNPGITSGDLISASPQLLTYVIHKYFKR